MEDPLDPVTLILHPDAPVVRLHYRSHLASYGVEHPKRFALLIVRIRAVDVCCKAGDVPEYGSTHHLLIVTNAQRINVDQRVSGTVFNILQGKGALVFCNSLGARFT